MAAIDSTVVLTDPRPARTAPQGWAYPPAGDSGAGLRGSPAGRGPAAVDAAWDPRLEALAGGYGLVLTAEGGGDIEEVAW